MLSTNYNKAAILVLMVIVILGAAIASASGELGLSGQALAWIAVAASVAGSLLAVLTGNKWQPTIPPGFAVVPASDTTTLDRAIRVRPRPPG